ncbi:MAG: cardiolipin synthase [Bacteroidales bacterium]|nr:cardiolipin synthase [Bacteroidales bacterium]
MKRLPLFFSALALSLLTLCAQPSDSLVAQMLHDKQIRITEGNSVHLLMSGYEKFEDMFREVEQAHHFIHMEYFNFRNDSINDLLIRLLAKKAEEGVEIRVMYDAFGNSSNNQPFTRAKHDSICSLGIRLEKFDPLRFPWLNHIYPRDHRKIVVIDGRVAYTGGMNVADYYVTGFEGIGPWRDLHMHIEGPAVDDLHEIFREMWYKQTGENLLRGLYFKHYDPQVGPMRVAIVDRKPHVRNEIIRDLYVTMLDNAQENVRIINPYFVPTHRVRRAIKRAVKRGVNVEIMVSARGDIPMTPETSLLVAHRLQKRGARVYVFHGGFHHTKAMTIDRRFCTIGSSNLDARSLRYDYEVNAVVFDPDLTHEFNAMFDRDIQNSEVMTDDWWKSQRRWSRFVGWFGNLLTPFL